MNGSTLVESYFKCVKFVNTSQRCDKMKLSYLLGKSMLYFNLFGQVIYQARNNSITPSLFFRIYYLRFLPGLLMFGATLLIAIGVSHYHLNYANFYGPTDIITFFVLLFTSVISIFVMLVQSLVFSGCYEQLYDQFILIENFTKFKFRINVKHFRNQYLVQVIFTTFHYLFNIVVVAYIVPGPKSDLIVDLYLIAISVIALLANFHALFYIKLLKFFLKGCSDNIELTISNHFQLGRFIENFKFYKRIHFKLWEVSILISNLFGWSLVSWLMHTFILALYMAYWTFLYLASPTEFYLILRK